MVIFVGDVRSRPYGLSKTRHFELILSLYMCSKPDSTPSVRPSQSLHVFKARLNTLCQTFTTLTCLQSQTEHPLSDLHNPYMCLKPDLHNPYMCLKPDLHNPYMCLKPDLHNPYMCSKPDLHNPYMSSKPDSTPSDRPSQSLHVFKTRPSQSLHFTSLIP